MPPIVHKQVAVYKYVDSQNSSPFISPITLGKGTYLIKIGGGTFDGDSVEYRELKVEGKVTLTALNDGLLWMIVEDRYR